MNAREEELTARALLADLAANGPPLGSIDLLIGSGRTIAAGLRSIMPFHRVRATS